MKHTILHYDWKNSGGATLLFDRLYDLIDETPGTYVNHFALTNNSEREVNKRGIRRKGRGEERRARRCELEARASRPKKMHREEGRKAAPAKINICYIADKDWR